MNQDTVDPGKSVLSAEAVAVQLGVGNEGKGGSRRVWAYVALAVAAVVGLLVAWMLQGNSSRAQYVTEGVTSGELVVRITATGNLQPMTQVEVGSEVSGTVDKVLVNDNDKVRRGQVLAVLDTSKLRDQVQEAESALVKARASLRQYKAATLQAQASLGRNEEAWKASGGMVPSKSDVETSRNSLEQAQANEASAAAAVDESQASLNTSRTDLSKASLRSSIDGVVLKRSVEPGQTVAASLQVTTLITLAQDLTQMKLEVNVDEADVGQVKEGQLAQFTVDAYPDRSYPARIVRLRYGSDTTNNVVTYQAVLEVDNKDLSLRPGMTADARIVTLRRENALQVPNAALRYTPARTDEAVKGSITSLLISVPKEQKAAQASTSVVNGSEQTVWKLVDGHAVAVKVKVGASDGKTTEVTKVLTGELKDGERLVVDSVEPSK